MKFTLGWLKEHLDTQASLADITAKLTSLGLEVEQVEDRAALYAPFRVAYVEKAEKHPDADRLRVCIVDTGTEKLQVVCGAPNARAGMKGVFAPAGSYIPGTDITLKKGVIRGQESNGMLVSEREMGLSEDHEGIIDVAADVAVGTPFAELYGLDDPLIEIAVTPNRADCTGVRGIARDLAAGGLGTLKPLKADPVKGGFKSPVGVRIEAEKACPLFIGRYIRSVKNGPSPDWLQRRLKSIGLRPISALVDITNYMTFGHARPLHVFDAKKLSGGIHVRMARKGEILEALNDKSYTLDETMCAVCDDSGVLGLGGIIGGKSTGCSEETTDVFLEAAYFDPMTIARAGRLLQVTSDARYRFERGIDPEFTKDGVEIATRMIIELCGGEASEPVVAGQVPVWKRAIKHDPAFVGKIAGLEIGAAEQKKILTALGFEISGDFSVQPPSWRGDVEGRADLAEEVLRVHGYDKIPAVSVVKNDIVQPPAETLRLSRARKARVALAARGMNESVTWSFMPQQIAVKFGANANQKMQALTIVNPISSDLDQMRPTPLGNLIIAAGRNGDRGYEDVALFETGPGFISVKPDGQTTYASGIRAGKVAQRHWCGADASRAADSYDVKADVLAVLESCGAPVDSLQITRDAPEWYHPGRSAALRLGPNVLAWFGEIHPGLLEDMKIGVPVAGFEIFLERIPLPKKKSGTSRPLLQLSPFQPVCRDFAFVVDEQVEAEALVRAVKSADKDLVTDVNVFDIYRGKGLDEGKKSVALSVTLQPKLGTLTDAEIEAVAGRIVTAAAAKTGAVLRG